MNEDFMRKIVNNNRKSLGIELETIDTEEAKNRRYNSLIQVIDSQILEDVEFEEYLTILTALTTNLIANSVTPKNLVFARDYMQIMQSEVLSRLSDEGGWE